MSLNRRVVWRAFFAGTISLALIGVWVASWRFPTGPASGQGLAAAGIIAPRHSATLRVATWNIHSGKGRDGVVDLSRIARQLSNRDFVGLNEVRGATGLAGPGQAETLGRQLQFGWRFHPYERRWGRDDFGNGVVSNCRINDWKRIPLPHTSVKGHGNIILHRVEWNDTQVRILVTHIDRQADRLQQLRLAIEEFKSLPEPAILMGDLNTTPTDPELAELLALPDVVDVFSEVTPKPPTNRIDWILVRGLKCVSAGTEDHGESDHPLVWADLQLPKTNADSSLPATTNPTPMTESDSKARR